MREMGLRESRRLRPVPLVVWGSTIILSFAILANAFFGQPSGNRSLSDSGASEGGVARMQVALPSTGGHTIQLKYDPVAESVQRELAAAGFYKGEIDGVVGRKTRAAIEAYQRTVGIEVTGEPSQDLAEHIRYTREVSEASLFTGSIEPDPDADARARIRRVQTGLAELAYNPGEINGEMTRATRNAITDFQHDRGLPETGEVTDELVAEIGRMSGQSDLSPQR
jgi:peptidoglycan hydrolase-like protein with peptidoglycan-binding domain